MSVLLWQHNKTLPRRNLNCLLRWPGMTKHLKNPSLQLFLVALPLYVTVVNTSAWISLPLFGWTLYYARQHCLSHCMNFPGKCFYSSGRHPSICCASTTAHEGGKFTGEFMLNNSCQFPFVGDGVLVASISEEKQSLIQLCKTDIQHASFFYFMCRASVWSKSKSNFNYSHNPKALH